MAMRARPVFGLMAAAALSGCATNPDASRPDIEYRTVRPGAAAPGPAEQVRRLPPTSVAGRTGETSTVGSGVSSSPAVQEAAAMPAQTGQRPGGSLRQPRDTPSARAIEVQRGDSLYEISRRYSVNMRAMIETNRLEPPYALAVGQVVYLPPPELHVVERGETLYSVSRRYNVDTRSLALLNGLARPWTVYPGDELLLPPLARDQGRAMTVAATAPVAVPPSLSPSPSPRPAAASQPGAGTTAAARYAANPASGSHTFLWPVSGQVLHGFGQTPDGQRNDGVNIATALGAEVRAAAAGDVVYAGNELAGFGNLLLLRHPGGWVSAYAHLEVLQVKEGDKVGQGAIIGRAGQTGSVNRPQVHFELRRGRDPVDPTVHLPALRDRP